MMYLVSDLIDIRPRVAEYNTSSTISPFDFASRSFPSQGIMFQIL